jgi:uncharacterized membrane protein
MLPFIGLGEMTETGHAVVPLTACTAAEASSLLPATVIGGANIITNDESGNASAFAHSILTGMSFLMIILFLKPFCLH